MPLFTLDAAEPGRDRAERFGIWTVQAPEVPLTLAASPRRDHAVLGGVLTVDIEHRVDAPQEQQVWQVRLPPHLAEAKASLAAYQQALTRSSQMLVDIEQRIDTVARRAQAIRRETPQVLSAPSPPGVPLTVEQLRALRDTVDEPEARLLDEFIHINRGERAGAAPPTPQQRLFQRIVDSLTTYARVETVLGEQRIACTVMGWLGNVQTIWKYPTKQSHRGISTTAIGLHQQSFQLALLSRATLVRSIVMAMRGAVKLWFLCSTPAGAMLAIPLLWDYIRRLLTHG